jgi:hypothetical protein
MNFMAISFGAVYIYRRLREPQIDIRENHHSTPSLRATVGATLDAAEFCKSGDAAA